eukprot:TRINITY_DN8590_c0_g1_i1.p1 TRINITY_DN8590_c0_g1~~TRINITY_DN8590_c0_g1_i1.p1  ORF type:complete len:386 (+),score=93.68 TRINITY_DN8590_c0_g1_i1:46-1203(+)
MRFVVLLLLGCVFASLLIVANSGLLKEGGGDVDWRRVSEKSVRALQKNWYKNGSWTSVNRWNNANSLEAVCNYLKISRSSSAVDISNHKLLRDAEKYFFAPENNATLIDSSDDDSLWFASAWTCMYELTGKQLYLQYALDFYDSVDSGGNFESAWDDSTCGGGVWWDRKNRGYKNAITNELYLFASLRLRDAVQGTRFEEQWLQILLGNAKKEAIWFLNSGMLNSDGLINDGLNPDCSNNHATTWTYNQGVILSGLGKMFTDTRNSTYLEVAIEIAQAVIRQMTTKNGVLMEPCEADVCSTDGQQFKGIFMRHLRYLMDAVGLDLPENTRREFVRFIHVNGESVLSNAQTDRFTFGYRWTGPMTEATSISQTAVIDLLNALQITS